jgi:hypothetical protein
MADPNLKKWSWDRFTTGLDTSLRKAGQTQNPQVGQIESGSVVTVEWPNPAAGTATVSVGNRKTGAFLMGGTHDQTIRTWSLDDYNLTVEAAGGSVTAGRVTYFWVF